MAFNFLEARMEKTISKIQKSSSIDEKILENFLEEFKIVFLESDINLNVINKLIEEIRNEAKNKIFINKGNKSQEFIDLVQNKLTDILGKATSDWVKRESQTVVMMVGLQGSGKTTTSAKIANYLHNKKMYNNPLLVSLDVYRPAAMEQLNKLADDLGFMFYAERDSKDVSKITKDAMDFAYDMENDLIIFDTAGRIQTDKQLMNELADVKKIIKPTEIIFVADGMSGQEIINVAKEFDETIKLTSTIITKLDSDAKGGAAISIISLLKIPVKFIGVGEKINDLEIFHPDRMASRILGFGDLETLQEKSKKVSKESDNERLMRKMMQGKFDLEDLMISLEQVSKMGNLRSVASMLPGVNISKEQSETADNKAKLYRVLIDSMTSKERKNPKLIKHPKRTQRILNGSGRNQKELNELLRQFEKSQKQMKEVLKYVKNGQIPKEMLVQKN